MAKRRGRRSRNTVNHSRSIQRDFSTIANRSRLLDEIQFSIKPAVFYPPVEDRRTFHPDGPFRSARTVVGTRASVKASPRVDRRSRSTAFKNLSSVINFRTPRGVLICVRRAARREVLFAKKRTAKGARSSRRQNWYSKVSCRR